ncbi:hypothetical protein HPB48_017697 [Haemaphysalis longicornis]|uniref:Uncharacterized protein n=1 Tax=Haemaphysalis longicornis TaxID=44386 RepID=A0A9J6GWG2_HAELO|nr:hypothetical protein HPB48_017697 [Haemaphysalis longicornis]
MKGNLGMRRTWAILRTMVDPTHSKTTSGNRLTTIIHKFDGTNEQLISRLRNLYLAQGTQEPLPAYGGSENSDMDRAVTVS